MTQIASFEMRKLPIVYEEGNVQKERQKEPQESMKEYMITHETKKEGLLSLFRQILIGLNSRRGEELEKRSRQNQKNQRHEHEQTSESGVLDKLLHQPRYTDRVREAQQRVS